MKAAYFVDFLHRDVSKLKHILMYVSRSSSSSLLNAKQAFFALNYKSILLVLLILTISRIQHIHTGST